MAAGGGQDIVRVHVIVPEGFDHPGQPTGGNIYDRRVCAGLAAAGWEVLVATVAGTWPVPGPDARADPGLLSQPPDLGRPHEALLAHILARGMGGRLRPRQRRQQWWALVLNHGPDQSGSRVCTYHGVTYAVTGGTDWRARTSCGSTS